jgi:hypothetical protein
VEKARDGVAPARGAGARPPIALAAIAAIAIVAVTVPFAAAATTPVPALAEAVPSPAPGSAQAPDARIVLETRLRARSAYHALAKHDPAAFSALVDAVARSPQAGASEEIVLAVARGHLAPIAFRAMARSTDTIAEDFARNLALEIRAAAPVQGDACFALLAPDDDGAVRLTKVDLGTLDDFDLDKIAEAIEKSATDSNPVPAHEAVARTVDPLMKNFRSRHGENATILERLDQPGVDKAKACKVAVELISQVLFRRDSKNAGTVLRYLFLTAFTAPEGRSAKP